MAGLALLYLLILTFSNVAIGVSERTRIEGFKIRFQLGAKRGNRLIVENITIRNVPENIKGSFLSHAVNLWLTKSVSHVKQSWLLSRYNYRRGFNSVLPFFARFIKVVSPYSSVDAGMSIYRRCFACIF